ncbi:hypothetical protein EDD18DRAFT_325355 [Armillaria luteobubalina]|uniref:DUF6535 domain-containing protein n=1 Tax=Armillaria luteobubalina TaxID=153913 RepID=A0AA39QNM0_9AGAR|nr:hypothetical protein EDD18DRAFT_325355 [Armillaria luteobubalina]
MGMERMEYIIKGSDPFDYEQKFPEDKQHEEMGPTARVWRTYLEECAPFDIEMMEGWRDGLDVLLVFAGLFSAVVTTFVAQTSQNLQVDYGQVTASLLIELISVQRFAANGSLVNDVPPSDLTFRPSTYDSWVNGLWFTSLSLSLTTALFAVLTKQWIHQYMSVPSGTPRDKCRVRQFRYMGLQQWRVAFIIGLLPVLMSTSLAAFLVGLVLFIVPLRVQIASVVGAITIISFFAYLVANFLPIVYPSCPYKTPLSQYIFPLYTYLLHNGLFNWLMSLISKVWTRPVHVSTSGAPTIRTLREAERMAVEDSSDETDVQALAWLIHMSSNPSVRNIVIESMSALPLKSVESLERCIPRISFECSTAFESLGSSQDASVHENKVDRLLRAHLRFTNSFYIRGMPRPAKLCFSPGIYADLLSIQKHCRREIRELVISNLKAVPDDPTALHLQPIVWAYLLQKLLPSGTDNLEVMQLLFIEIPSFYWSANFTPSTQVIDRQGMKIPYRDGIATTLRMAIQECLYQYVAEVLLQDHMCIEHTVFYQNHTDVHLVNSRLCLLLSMAGSSSMRSMANSVFLSPHSLFTGIMGDIASFLEIKPLSSHRGLTPTIPVNSNRHAVLKLLYTLISSVEFNVSLTLHERNVVLTMFFQVSSSTSPCPRFLRKYWCTPQLAVTFVHIVFKEYPRDTPYCHHSAYELGTFFVRSTSFTNETLAYFVKSLFEQLRTQEDYLLLMFLNLIVPEMQSNHLGTLICQQSLEYLHEPDVLFTLCKTLFALDATNMLRRLAGFRPKDPAWDDCIQRLQDLQSPKWGNHQHIRILNAFKAFMEARSLDMDAFGMHDDPYPERYVGVSIVTTVYRSTS